MNRTCPIHEKANERCLVLQKHFVEVKKIFYELIFTINFCSICVLSRKLVKKSLCVTFNITLFYERKTR